MPNPAKYSFEAIGTYWTIEIFEHITSEAFGQLQSAIIERTESFDRTYSRFRADSLITDISRQPAKYTLPPDAAKLFELYGKLYDLTHGSVTPLIGQALSDAGYDAEYSLQPKTLSSPPAWSEAMVYAAPTLSTFQPVLLDFGAAGKGYLIDLIEDIVLGNGYTAFCIEAGGDMLYRAPSGPPLQIGLEDPSDPAKVIGVVDLKSGSLCGSAGNRRSWKGYHHIIDPHTLKSPGHLQSVWVTAESAIIADALTTALFFCDPSILRHHFDFEFALLKQDNYLEASPGFPAEFFTKESS